MSKVRLLVGTRKGAFVLTADGTRDDWDVRGPFFTGWEIYHVNGSPAEPDRLYASQTSGWFGQIVQRSDDGGETWEPVGNEFAYDGETGAATSGTTGRSTRGSSPASGTWSRRTPIPTRSTPAPRTRPSSSRTDGGQTWKDWGLRTHTTGEQWQPGAGGLCLHTILIHPEDEKRMHRGDLGGGNVPHRRRRRDLAADQQGTMLPRTAGRGSGRSATASTASRWNALATRPAVHAEALARDAERRRRRLLARR